MMTDGLTQGEQPLLSGFGPRGSLHGLLRGTDPTVTVAFRVNSEKRQELPCLGVQDMAVFSEPGGCEGCWK